METFVKIGSLVKNRIFFSKNGNFCQKSKFWIIIEILVKNRHLVETFKVLSKIEFGRKIEMLIKNPHLVEN